MKRTKKVNDVAEKLASVEKRTELYLAVLWQNVNCQSTEEFSIRALTFITAYLILHLTDLMKSSLELTESLLPDDFFSQGLPNRYFVEIGIDASLLLSLYLIFKNTLPGSSFLKCLPGYEEEIWIDAFSPNLLAEDCDKEIEKIGEQTPDSFFQKFEINFGLWSALAVGPHVIFGDPIINRFIMTAVIMSAKVLFLPRIILSVRGNTKKYRELCEAINLIFPNIKFTSLDDLENKISIINGCYSFLGRAKKFNEIVFFKIKIDHHNLLKVKDKDNQYFLLMLVKQILENNFDCQVDAFDENSLLIQWKKNISITPDKVTQAKKNATVRIGDLNTQIKQAVKYIKLLNVLTGPLTYKKWQKLFAIDNDNLFSFSLNSKNIDSVEIERLILNIKVFIQNANVFTFGHKLVVEGELNNLTSKQFENAEKLVQKILVVKTLPKKEIEDSNSNANEPSIQPEHHKDKKIRPPKFSGASNFFAPYKRPQLKAIVWDKFKDFPLFKNPYLPISHVCSNKIIFYSTFTLKPHQFTEKETFSMFLNILKTGAVKSKTTGSCIIFLSQEERASLKEQIKILAGKNPILFKLHTPYNSRVYGVLKDEGNALYDDGCKVHVKMIDWCIIDQKAHSKKSNHIYAAASNPFLDENKQSKTLTLRRVP